MFSLSPIYSAHKSSKRKLSTTTKTQKSVLTQIYSKQKHTQTSNTIFFEELVLSNQYCPLFQTKGSNQHQHSNWCYLWKCHYFTGIADFQNIHQGVSDAWTRWSQYMRGPLSSKQDFRSIKDYAVRLFCFSFCFGFSCRCFKEGFTDFLKNGHRVQYLVSVYVC